MKGREKPNLQTVNRRVDSVGRCYVPRLFVQSVGDTVAFTLKDDGVVLSPATKGSSITVSNDGSTRICVPRNILRLFGKPNVMEVSFVNGRADVVFLRPVKIKCCRCGKMTNLIDLHKKEIYACTECLNKAFALSIPLYEDDSI